MAGQTWTFDTVHSILGFWVRHLMVSKVHGAFTKWSGTVELDEQDPTRSKAEVEIETLHQKIDLLREQEIARLADAVDRLTKLLEAKA